MANAHALEEDCRPIVEEMIRQAAPRRLRFRPATATARIAPRQPQSGMPLWSLRKRMTSWCTSIHR